MIAKKILYKIIGCLIKKSEFLGGGGYQRIYPLFLKKLGVDIDTRFLGGGREYIHPSVIFDGGDYSLIHIGYGTTISREVLILTHDFSIQKGLSFLYGDNSDTVKQFKKDVFIGNNCFIGARSTVLPGTNIGNNTIIGANSVCKGQIDGDSIYAGNPARKICGIEQWTNMHVSKHDYI